MRSQLSFPAIQRRRWAKGLKARPTACSWTSRIPSPPPTSRRRARHGARIPRRSAQAREAPASTALDWGLTDADLDGIMAAAPDGIPPAEIAGRVDMCSTWPPSSRCAKPKTKSRRRFDAHLLRGDETASAVFGLASYRGASRRLSALTWGAKTCPPISARTNAWRTACTRRSCSLRNMTLLAGGFGWRAADRHGLIRNFRDGMGSRNASRRDATDLPARWRSIPPRCRYQEIFTPPAEDRTRRRKIVKAFADNPEAGVIGLDGEMLDKPHLERAKETAGLRQRLIRRAHSSERTMFTLWRRGGDSGICLEQGDLRIA